MEADARLAPRPAFYVCDKNDSQVLGRGVRSPPQMRPLTSLAPDPVHTQSLSNASLWCPPLVLLLYQLEFPAGHGSQSPSRRYRPADNGDPRQGHAIRTVAQGPSANTVKLPWRPRTYLGHAVEVCVPSSNEVAAVSSGLHPHDRAAAPCALPLPTISVVSTITCQQCIFDPVASPKTEPVLFIPFLAENKLQHRQWRPFLSPRGYKARPIQWRSVHS